MIICCVCVARIECGKRFLFHRYREWECECSECNIEHRCSFGSCRKCFEKWDIFDG